MHFTHDQFRLLTLVGAGLDNQEIKAQIGDARLNVAVAVHELCQVLGVETRVQAMIKYLGMDEAEISDAEMADALDRVEALPPRVKVVLAQIIYVCTHEKVTDIGSLAEALLRRKLAVSLMPGTPFNVLSAFTPIVSAPVVRAFVEQSLRNLGIPPNPDRGWMQLVRIYRLAQAHALYLELSGRAANEQEA